MTSIALLALSLSIAMAVVAVSLPVAGAVLDRYPLR
jgi:hypothetical protein